MFCDIRNTLIYTNIFFREKSFKYCRPRVNVCYYIRAVLKWQRALVSDVNK